MPDPGRTSFPTRLSETGLFASTADHRLAAGLILERRMYADREFPAGVEKANERLQQLREGVRIFGLQSVMDAGNSNTTFMVESDWERLNLATFQADRFFGIRSNRDRQSR